MQCKSKCHCYSLILISVSKPHVLQNQNSAIIYQDQEKLWAIIMCRVRTPPGQISAWSRRFRENATFMLNDTRFFLLKIVKGKTKIKTAIISQTCPVGNKSKVKVHSKIFNVQWCHASSQQQHSQQSSILFAAEPETWILPRCSEAKVFQTSKAQLGLRDDEHL